MRRVKIGLIGAGVIGARHIEAIDTIDALELLCIADPAVGTQKICQERGIPQYQHAESMIEAEEPKASDLIPVWRKEELREAFGIFDDDKSDTLDLTELQVALRALGFDSKKEKVRKILDDIDDDNSGTIEFEEFVVMMTGMTASEKDEEGEKEAGEKAAS